MLPAVIEDCEALLQFLILEKHLNGKAVAPITLHSAVSEQEVASLSDKDPIGPVVADLTLLQREVAPKPLKIGV